MSKSLRKRIKRQPTEKVSKNLHLVKGEHSVTHSHSPISADEIEKLVAINPDYADRLFDIMEKSLDLEEKEINLYFKAVDKEQENDELAIVKQADIAKNSLVLSSVTLVFLILSAVGFVYMEQPWIAGLVMSSVVGVVIKAIMGKKASKEDEK